VILSLTGVLGGFSSIFNGQTAQANTPRAMEFGLRISFLDLSRSSLVSWQILGEHFILRGLAVCQPFQPASVCSTATTFLAPAGANSAGPIDSYAGSPLDFQFFSGNLNKRRPTKKGRAN
jgi:hypothetical protein